MFRASAAIFLLSAGFFLNPAAAAPKDDLKSFLSAMKTSEGSFEQETFDKEGKPMEKPSAGTFLFSRPGKFIWSYERPYEQKIICDGIKLYIWDKDLDQVSVRNARGALPKSPASLLFGETDFEKNWKITSEREENGLSSLTLEPKQSDALVKSVTFTLKGKDLLAAQFTGNFNEKTHVKFLSFKTGVTLPKDAFRFIPPKGADVVNIN